jgi:uncharacterized protein with HEPN domain
MNPNERKFSFYLEDILTSLKRIEEYLGDLDFVGFKRNYLIVDGVIRNFEIIGEAAKHIPDFFREKYPEIPFEKMYGLRSIITHEYFGIDYEIIWEIAKNELPKNLQDLERIIEIEKKHWH